MSQARRTVLITGCSKGGIGEELARQFHGQGLRVIATARNVKSMEPLSALGIETLPLDVSVQESIDNIQSQVQELTGGKLDVLVNNAGLAYPYAAVDIDLKKAKELFDVNLFGVMAMVKAFIPMLIASGDARIVNIGSLGGVLPVPFGSVYNASKAALHAYGDSIRIELAPFNIKVLTVVAGNIQSNITKLYHDIPKGSLYMPIRAEYRSQRLERFHDTAVPRDKVARKIVGETLKRRGPRAWLWVGANSWLGWIFSIFLPRTAFDKILGKIFGLNKLAQLVKKSKKD